MPSIHAVLDRLQQNIGRQARIAVRVELQGAISQHLLHGRNERRNTLRRQQAAGVLEEHGIDAESHEVPCLADVVVVRVHGAEREDEAAGDVHAMPLAGFDRDLQVAHVVQRVVGRVIAHAVGSEALRRQLDDVVGEKLEGEKALPARMYDEWRLLHP